MSWPEATYKIIEVICWSAVAIAGFAAFFGIDININRKDD